MAPGRRRSLLILASVAVLVGVISNVLVDLPISERYDLFDLGILSLTVNTTEGAAGEKNETCPRIYDSGDSNEERCALLFYGVPRLFSKAFPTIQKNILEANPICDVYAHTYDQVNTTTGRGYKDGGVPMNFRDVLSLTKHVVVDTMEQFHARRNLTIYRQTHHRGWGKVSRESQNGCRPSV
jgi:hypothetical protein